MKITYLISTKGNPIYDGDFRINNSYKTYGQHSFIYDFVMVGKRMNLDIEIIIDDIESFPLYNILSKRISIRTLNSIKIVSSDIIIIEAISNNVLDGIELRGFIIGLNHNHLKKESDAFYFASKVIVCLTENAKINQSQYVNNEKIIVLKQGIDLKRFTRKLRIGHLNSKSALIFSRMNTKKGEIYNKIVDKLIDSGFEVTVVGDGVHFWQIVKNYLDAIIPIDYIPCYSIHRFLSNFDLIITNGRGVMESMACGIPTIAAGIRYGGIVSSQNIDFLFERNFTCSNVYQEISNIEKDIEAFDKLPVMDYSLIEKHFDMTHFISGIQKIYQEYGIS